MSETNKLGHSPTPPALNEIRMTRHFRSFRSLLRASSLASGFMEPSTVVAVKYESRAKQHPGQSHSQREYTIPSFARNGSNKSSIVVNWENIIVFSDGILFPSSSRRPLVLWRMASRISSVLRIFVLVGGRSGASSSSELSRSVRGFFFLGDGAKSDFRRETVPTADWQSSHSPAVQALGSLPKKGCVRC